jgi:hypothetical protein
MHRHDETSEEIEITYASRWLDVPVQVDRGRFWGLAFARSGERIAYVTHGLGFCQVLASNLDGSDRRPLVSLDVDEVISEVHGFGVDDRYIVFSVQVRGRHEIRAVEIASRVVHHVAYESYFGGWDDAHDAFFVWNRATGSRDVTRVTVGGPAKHVDAGHMDRRIARSEDGRTVWFAQKFSDDAADKRFTLYKSDDRGQARVPVAMIATTCRASRVKLALSPEGKYLHVSALGTMDEGSEAVSFDLVVATDGTHRRLLPVKGWVAGDRAIAYGRHKTLDLVDPKTGDRRTLVHDAVDQFSVSADGRVLAFLAGGALQVVGIPA